MSEFIFNPAERLWYYKAEVIRVYDGDTCFMNISMGCGIFLLDEPIRFMNVKAPEVRGDEKVDGFYVRDRLNEKIGGKKVILRTELSAKGYDVHEKYGRLLAYVFLDGENINDWLIEMGYATRALSAIKNPIIIPFERRFTLKLEEV